MLRGTDSTGLACIDSYTVPATYKRPIPAMRFYDVKRDIIRRDHIARPILLGHNRYATTGKVNTLNAHPFTCGNVTGIHNGVIYNHKRIFKVINRRPKTQCDSEIVVALMDYAFKIPHKILMLGEIEGSYTCAFYDRRYADTVFFTVKDNPLYIARVGKALIFSSQAESIYMLGGTMPVKTVMLLPNGYLYQHNVKTGKTDSSKLLPDIDLFTRFV
jgi:glucosamine 6-phosphate synthetase-like amidotransferase/phosphosugar isomerase protein